MVQHSLELDSKKLEKNLVQHWDGRIRVYRRKNERFANNCVVEVDRFGGGSVMMWGAITYSRRTPLVLVPGNLTAQRYRDNILQPHLLPVINKQRKVFQHDNVRLHTAVATVDFLANLNVTVQPWSSKSRIWIPLSISGINWINVCACVNQPLKVFYNYSRHYRRNRKEYPRSKFNVLFNQCGDELQQFYKQMVVTQDTDVFVHIQICKTFYFEFCLFGDYNYATTIIMKIIKLLKQCTEYLKFIFLSDNTCKKKK
jgi:hypothetical protein